MKYLDIQSSFSVIKLDLRSDHVPLTQQAEEILKLSPYIILDADNIAFTSMLIGEVITLARAFGEQWKDRDHQMALVRVTDNSKLVLKMVRIEQLVPIYDSFKDAIAKMAGE